MLVAEPIRSLKVVVLVVSDFSTRRYFGSDVQQSVPASSQELTVVS